MRWALLLLSVGLGCGSGATDSRVEAFGWAEKGRLDQAASSVTRCAHVGDEDDRFSCANLLAEIRMRQGLYTEATLSFRQAFAIRDRIAKAEKYGPPNADSLHQWGWALIRTGHPQEARPVLERARASASSYDERLILAAALLELADIANAQNRPSDAASLTSEARNHACQTEEMKYFGTKGELHMRWFPKDVWLALAANCAQPSEAAQLRDRAATMHP